MVHNGVSGAGGNINQPLSGRINPNIPKPQAPPNSIFGRSFHDWGKHVVRWGTGTRGAAARARSITLQEIQQAGITEAQAQEALAFYTQVVARDAGNAAAAARVQLMNRILALLKGGRR